MPELSISFLITLFQSTRAYIHVFLNDIPLVTQPNLSLEYIYVFGHTTPSSLITWRALVVMKIEGDMWYFQVDLYKNCLWGNHWSSCTDYVFY